MAGRIITLEGYRKTADFTRLTGSLRRDHATIARFLSRKPSAGRIRDIVAIPDQMGGRFPKETYRVLLFVEGRATPFIGTLPAGISEGQSAARLMGTAEGMSLKDSHTQARQFLQDTLKPKLVGRNVAELGSIEAEFKLASDEARAANPRLGPYENMGAQNSLGITIAMAYAIADLANVPVTSVINYFYNKALESKGYSEFEPISLPMVQGVLGDCGRHGLALTLDQMAERGILTAEGRRAFPVQLASDFSLPVIAPQEALALYRRFDTFDAMIAAAEKVSAAYLKLLKGAVPEDSIHRGAESGYTSQHMTSLHTVLTLMRKAYEQSGMEGRVSSSLDVAMSELVLTPDATSLRDILCFVGPELADNATGVLPLSEAYERIVAIARAFNMPIVEDLAPEADAMGQLSRADQIAAMALAGNLLADAGIAAVADDTTVGNPALAQELVVDGRIAGWILLKDTQSGSFLTLVDFAATGRANGIRLNNSHRGNAVAGERWPGHLAVGLGAESAKFTPWGTGRGEKIVAMREIEAIYASLGIMLPFWGNPAHTGLFKN
ncbi:MAG: hypothetical protein WC901_05075 [Candidatus Margulisiibacteriota bacterium]